MVDTAMASAAIVRGQARRCGAHAGRSRSGYFGPWAPASSMPKACVMRWGGSVGFLDGDLKDEKGRTIVHATSAIKIIRPKVKG